MAYWFNDNESHLDVAPTTPDPDTYRYHHGKLTRTAATLAMTGAVPAHLQEHLDDLELALNDEGVYLFEDEVETLRIGLEDILEPMGLQVTRTGFHFTAHDSHVPSEFNDILGDLKYLLDSMPNLIFNGVLIAESDDYRQFRRIVIEDSAIQVQAPSYIIWETIEE